MTLLAQCKPIASIMPDMTNWIPAQTNPPSGAVIEQSSLLGRFFSLSPIAPGVPQSFFRDPKLMTPGDRLSMSNSVRDALRQYQEYLFKICNYIIKSGIHGRRGVLDWFSAALSQNEKRKALQVDPATVASDGFMVNIVAVLNKFADPFISITANKATRPVILAYSRSTKWILIISERYLLGGRPLASISRMKLNSRRSKMSRTSISLIPSKTSTLTSSVKSSS